MGVGDGLVVSRGAGNVSASLSLDPIITLILSGLLGIVRIYIVRLKVIATPYSNEFV